MKNFLFIVLIFFLSTSLSQADNPFFIDFQYILNESNAGKKAQKSLKTKLENTIDKLQNTIDKLKTKLEHQNEIMKIRER